MPSLPLLLSLAALGIGPLLYSRARAGLAAAVVDAFALIAVAGLVFAHILPQSFALGGWIVLPVALLGLLGPGFLCGSRLFAGKSAIRITLPVALLGIGMHAMLDGIVLSGGGARPEAHFLLLAVVLHRIPDGLGTWWLVRPLYGTRTAWILLGAIGLFTVMGYYFGTPLLEGAPESWVAMLQALVAGSLLHVIFRHPPTQPARGAVAGLPHRMASGLGGLLGIGLMVALESYHLQETTVFGSVHETFLALALSSAPALLLAYVVIGALHALRLDLPRLLGRGGELGQAVRGTLLGLPIPICSCGVIPLYRGLIQQRVPVPAAMSFLVATPELGFAAIFLSWSLLGGEITLARAGSAVLLALVIGWFVGRRAGVRPDVEVRPLAREPAGSIGARIRSGLGYGFGDMLDGTAPWILVGIALAALLEPLLGAGQLTSLPAGLEVPLFALAGMPLYVCASGSTPLVAVLIAKGASPGAAIAFLLTGPATNITTYGVLSRLHGRRTALLFAAGVAVCTIALGYAVDALLPHASATMPPILHEHGASWIERASAAVLAVVFGWSLLRQGTRGFVGQVISPHGRTEDDDGHDHDHPHDPGLGHGHSHAPGGACCSA